MVSPSAASNSAPIGKRSDSNRASSRTSSHSESSTKEQAPTKKRIPPIKAPVGLVKGPDLSNCRSKVGSLQNIKHNPASSGVVIPNQKLSWNAKSKVGSLDNKDHRPGGGKLQVETKKLEWKTTSKVQSLANIKHKPGGGNVKIFNETFQKAKQNEPSPSSEVESVEKKMNGINLNN